MKQERKSKQFWGVDDSSVSLVTGYECASQAGVWWVPELGYSMKVGIHLFDTKKPAIEKAREYISGQRASLMVAENKLNFLEESK